MKNKLILIGILILLVIPLILAVEPYYEYKQKEEVQLKVFCRDENNSLCATGTACNITILYPNSSVLADGNMTYHPTYFSYNLTRDQTSLTGEYYTAVVCEGSSSGSIDFFFKITPLGETMDISDAIVYLGAFLLLTTLFIISLIGFIKTNKPAKKLFCWYGIYIFGVALTYIVWITTINIVGTTSYLGKFFYWIWIILLVMFFPMMIFSVIWYIWLMINMKQIQDMMYRGVPEDQAYFRQVKKGRAKWRRLGGR